MAPPLSAQQTIARARTLLNSGRGAALPELLKIIETLSLNISEVPVSQLAELIEKDAVVLARIISVANTIAHNPGIAPIATLSQAIHQIGYNRIRTIAVSMMLLENAGGANPPEQRDAAAFALCAGLMAQGAAEFSGTHDPEFVFACATLRNFGRILMAAVSPEHCREAIELMRRDETVDGFAQRFGLSALQLSREILKAVRLPDDVMRALSDCEPEELNARSATYDTRLLALADFGGRIATLALQRGNRSERFFGKVAQLARRFQRVVPGAEDVAKPALIRANERLRSFTRCSGCRNVASSSLQSVQQRLDVLSETLLDQAAPLRMQPVLPAIAATAAEMAVSARDDATEDAGVAPVDGPAWAAAVADGTETKNAAWSDTSQRSPTAGNALAAACNEVAAEECWLFQAQPGATTLSLATGIGVKWIRVQPTAAIRAEERTVFGVCLSRRDVVLVHDTEEQTLQTYLPLWWRAERDGLRAFALIPIAAADASCLLVLVGWSTARRVELSKGQVATIHRLFTRPPAANAA